MGRDEPDRRGVEGVCGARAIGLAAPSGVTRYAWWDIRQEGSADNLSIDMLVDETTDILLVFVELSREPTCWTAKGNVLDE